MHDMCRRHYILLEQKHKPIHKSKDLMNIQLAHCYSLACKPIRYGDLSNSRVIFEPPMVHREQRVWPLESGFGHFEVFRKKISSHVPRESAGKTQERPKSAILRRFYSKVTINVSILTNFMVRNPIQRLVYQILAIFTLKSKMATILHIN